MHAFLSTYVRLHQSMTNEGSMDEIGLIIIRLVSSMGQKYYNIWKVQKDKHERKLNRKSTLKNADKKGEI